MSNLTIIPTQYLEAISPILIESNKFLEEIKNTKITNEETYSAGAKIKKEVTAFLNSAKEKRLEITKPVRDLVTAINSKAEESLAPATEAKGIIIAEILAYEEILAEQKRAEALRIAKINEVFILGKVKETVSLNLEMSRKIEAYFKTLAPLDQQNPEIKQACQSLLQRVNAEISIIKEREAQKAEAERLAILKAQNDIEATKIALIQQEQAKKQRDIEAEARRLKDLEISQKLEAEKLREEKILPTAPKTGMRTYTKFEIIDANLVPREFCSPDPVLINQALKSGIKEIEGLRIYTEKK